MCKQANTRTTLEGNIGPGVGDLPAFIHTRIKASTVHTDMRSRDSFGHAMLSRGLHLVDASSVAFSSPDPGAAVPPLSPPPDLPPNLPNPLRRHCLSWLGTGDFSSPVPRRVV